MISIEGELHKITNHLHRMFRLKIAQASNLMAACQAMSYFTSIAADFTQAIAITV